MYLLAAFAASSIRGHEQVTAVPLLEDASAFRFLCSSHSTLFCIPSDCILPCLTTPLRGSHRVIAHALAGCFLPAVRRAPRSPGGVPSPVKSRSRGCKSALPVGGHSVGASSKKGRRSPGAVSTDIPASAGSASDGDGWSCLFAQGEGAPPRNPVGNFSAACLSGRSSGASSSSQQLHHGGLSALVDHLWAHHVRAAVEDWGGNSEAVLHVLFDPLVAWCQ